MPRDGFYEESAISNRSRTEEKLYMTFRVIAIALFAIAVIAGIAVTPILVGAVMGTEQATTADRIFAIGEWVVLLLVLVGAGLVFWFMKNRFNVSYDYTFVEDELRITKVFNGRKRKYLTTLKADRILQIGWVDSDSFERTMQGYKGKKAKMCTPNKEPAEGKEMIYVVHSSTIEKAVYILEVRRQLLENLVYAAGRNKLERK